MDRDWTDILRERLLDHEEPVPEGLWDRIEATLEARRKARAKRRIFLWSAAAAAAVALGVFAGVNLVDKEIDKDEFIAQDSQEHRTLPQANPSSSVEIEEVPVSSGKLVASNDIPLSTVLPVRDDRAEVIPAEPQVEPETVPELQPAPIVVAAEEEMGVKEEPKKSQEVPFETDHDGEDWSKYSSATDDGRLSNLRKLVAGLSLTSTAAGSQDINTVESSIFFKGNSPIASYDDASFAPHGQVMSTKGSKISPHDYIATNTRAVSEPVTKDEKHRRPIRAALSLSYPLNDFLWLESGLTYSMLYSSFTTSSGVTVSEDSQALGYLGIPLNLRASLLDWKIFDVYLSGGGMAEKCVKGVVKSSTLVSGTPRGDANTRKLDVKPLQWSVNAAAGLQLNVRDMLGIYAEPGVSYHFASNANVRSIYSQHPLDFVMTFGARFSFK
ncbi:MAG: hypothetical protein J6Y06_00225 [Bacteroidales bacterium]|nr:hypothetical protein [Bacteroidales bacterium]